MSKKNLKYPVLAAMLVAGLPMAASATVIVAQTVPWVAASPTTPHSSWNGNATTLKGVANVTDGGSNTIVYDWNPGDGGAHCTGTVTFQYVIECAHTYTGAAIGTVYNAVLTVYDNTTGTGVGGSAPYSNTSSASYYVEIYSPPPNLSVEVNAAIDAGLWYLHKSAFNVTGGNLNTLTVTNPGQNYALHYEGNYYQDVSFTVAGAGTGGQVCGSADYNPSSPTYGQITSAYLCSGGTGYSGTATVTATDGYCGYKPDLYAGQLCGSGFAATVTASPVTYSGAFSSWSGTYGGVAANNCNAFEVSGHLESGPSSDPYTSDVHACLQYVFSLLQSTAISSSRTNTHGSYNPDSNGNGLGVHLVDGYGQDQYQSGMMIDVVTASGTPNAPVTTAPLSGLTHPGNASLPYTYKDAVVDMVDYDIYCESANGSTSNQGSWVYGCQPSYGDNSVAQWVAIGMVSGIRDFGATVPTNAKLGNQDWLAYSQAPGFGGNGYFGYSSTSPAWGPYATTPAGMVQLAFNGIGRSPTATLANNSSATQWDFAETFMRDNFDNPQQYNPNNDVKDYYYGLFSFTKSMLLHDNSGTGTSPTPIQNLRSLDNAAKPDIDWYAAQDSYWGGTDTSNGVARTLISGTSAAENGGSPVTGQNSDGSWSGHDYTNTTSPFNTAWAVIMLNRTVTQIPPSACITPLAPTGPDGTSVHVSGGCSNTTDPTKTIVSWQWDVSCTAGGGTAFTQSGVNLNYVFTKPALTSYPYSCPVRLRVTDSGGITADLVFNDIVTAPNGVVPPVANVGGPYSFCKNITPWYFDGSQTSQAPPATISSYNWDYSCSNTFTSSNAVQPRVDSGANNLFSLSAGGYCVALQVVNSSSEASVQTTSYTIHAATDTSCTDCVSNLVAKAKNAAPGNPGNVQLYWYDTNSAALPVTHYNIYRSSNASFSPFIVLAGQGGPFAAVPVPATHGAQVLFVDTSAAQTGTYYYRVSPATSNDSATCSSPITLSATVGGRN